VIEKYLLGSYHGMMLLSIYDRLRKTVILLTSSLITTYKVKIMNLNAIGLLLDLVGFSLISIGTWEDLKHRKKQSRYKRQLDEFQTQGRSRDDFLKMLIQDKKNEIKKYVIHRKQELEYLLDSNKAEEECRRFLNGNLEKTVKGVYYGKDFDGNDFNPETFEKATKKRKDKLYDSYNDLINQQNIHLEEDEIKNNFIIKVANKWQLREKYTVLKQTYFLKFGVALVLIGFLLQFLYSIK
jgi:hypothetical protein